MQARLAKRALVEILRRGLFLAFSGVKDSGLGREGPKYAMQEMTEERLITISL